MRIIHNLIDYPSPPARAVLTLGVFDGLHRGHSALLAALQKRSRNRLERILVTYNPHPDLVLGKRQDRRSELFTYDEKLALLQRYDLDTVVFLPFTEDLAKMKAETYLRDVLVGKLGASHIIIGYDQTFGRNREGDYRFLLDRSSDYDYQVEQIKEVKHRGEIISSSAIRDLVRSGDISKANVLLGHDYFMTGIVVRGHRRGRDMGFPTANVDVSPTKVLPAEGVYAGYATRGREEYRCMINVGRNPTFEQGYLSIEAHLLNFDGDLYRERLRVFFRKRIRDEMKFSGPEDLKARLEKDRRETEKVRLHDPAFPGASFLNWKRKKKPTDIEDM